MYLIGAVLTGIFGFVYFAMLNTGSEPIIFCAIILSLIPDGCAIAALRSAISSLPSSQADQHR